jgi:hypothetical protein
MKITFAQSDIVTALRAHIVSQGISLEGKAVDIKFTMKKGNAGVAADVSIENAPQLPDLSDDTTSPQRPALQVAVDNTSKAVPAAVPAAEVKGSNASDEPAQPAAEVAPEAAGTGNEPEAAAEAAPPAKTASLFK